MANIELADLAKSSLHAMWSDFDLAIRLLTDICDGVSLHNIALIYPLIEAISGHEIARVIMTRILSIRSDFPLQIRDLDFPLPIRDPDEPRQLHRFIPQGMVTLYPLNNDEILAGQSSRKFKIYCGSPAFSYCVRNEHIIISKFDSKLIWHNLWASLYHDFAVSFPRQYWREALRTSDQLHRIVLKQKCAIFEKSEDYGPWTNIRAIIGVDPIWKIVRIPLIHLDEISKIHTLRGNEGTRLNDEQHFRAQLQYSNRFMFVLPEHFSRKTCVALIAQLNRAIMGCLALDIWHHNGDVCCRIKCDSEREPCALDCMRFVPYIGTYVPHINAPGMISYKAHCDAYTYIPLSQNLPIFYYDPRSYANEAQTYV